MGVTDTLVIIITQSAQYFILILSRITQAGSTSLLSQFVVKEKKKSTCRGDVVELLHVAAIRFERTCRRCRRKHRDI